MTRRSLLMLPVLLFAAPAAAGEIRCEGAFAADSSEARLVELYGKDHVVTGETDGPEGSTVITTTVFGDDPERILIFGWWNEIDLAELSYVELPPGDVAPGGLRPGLTVREVEALNGEPFTLTGFWWDYGGYAGFQSGKLANIPGGCGLSAYFQPGIEIPEGLDVDPVSGDREVPSTEPLLETLDVRVESVTLGYPFPEIVEDMQAMEAAGQGSNG